MKLTKAAVADLALPAGQSEAIFWDTGGAPGLGLRLRAGGSRNWVFQYRIGRQQRRIGLGKASAVSAADARAQASKMHARVKLGEDPAAQKAEGVARASETFESLLGVFLARQAERLKPKSYAEVERHLRVQSKPFHRLPLAKIDRRAVAKLLAEIGVSSGPFAANRLRASLMTFFSWAMREGLIDSNVVIATNKNAEGRGRERVLTDLEVAAVWAATAGADQYSAIVRLLLLTASRRDEIGGLRWAEVDLDRALISLPGERVKNGRPFDIPLSPSALAIIEAQPRRPDHDFVFGRGQGGFSGWSKSKSELDRRANIAPWRLHDLRRTASTVMHDVLAVQPHVVEAVLGHVSGHKAGVAGVYNRAAYANDRRRALTLWAEHVVSVVEDRPAKVVALRP
jgi:integrase